MGWMRVMLCLVGVRVILGVGVVLVLGFIILMRGSFVIGVVRIERIVLGGLSLWVCLVVIVLGGLLVVFLLSLGGRAVVVM